VSANDNPKKPVRRGRKPRNKAVLDFSVADAAAEYDELRAQMRNTDTGDLAPYEAAAEAMEKTRAEFGNISSKRLLNLRSEFKKVRVSPSDEMAPDRHDPPDHERDPRRRR
jgi:hypothetical protein